MNCDIGRISALLFLYIDWSRSDMLKVNNVKPKCLPWGNLCCSDTVIPGGCVIPDKGLVLGRLDGAQRMLCAAVFQRIFARPYAHRPSTLLVTTALLKSKCSSQVPRQGSQFICFSIAPWRICSAFPEVGSYRREA